MPYITQDKRDAVDEEIKQLVSAIEVEAQSNPENLEGIMNYAITQMVHSFYGSSQFSTSYKQISKATGMLENVKQEFYRKVAAPYEDLAEQKNGPLN